MKQQYVALADLVGQLLAAQWIQEHEQDQRDARPDAKNPNCRTAEPRSYNHDDKEDV